ncbi:Neutral alpha-glucosidase C, putative [Perkinsus marinus ATCC 50983]|uniref:Neutral alpha-glucosidase C, putative n=1 Tax=Perkinsus marinus (strain ATCC 50983 / TXsc) TaxID=423536 RepID=C5KCQ4_PERM5|nr:Neutral alpha-glucosidase C, putative [Perkinsus marinus ATCC 50983]EER17653.1 Neutral alpha-glucosidase C, putative [Perkinsus marinus ATCC 50983]|eukprot:XP_002785857.1 Neutral alpha-glucosidase C, putative [Perkinsus marinus ATCC 50983]
MSVLLSPYNLPASEDVKYIDPACSPGTHDGSWAEEYGGRTDYKPYGPSLVGIDISFSDVEAVYGLQERGTTSSKLESGGTSDLGLYRFFNLDFGAYPVDGDRNHGAIYGSIPTLTAVQKNRSNTPFVSSLLWVNPSDTAVALNGCCGDLSTTFLSESGVIDLFLFPGMKPQEFSTAYHHTTGLPALPPLFGLGFHRSRYAIESQQYTEELAANYTRLGFPVDVFWLGIEHTKGKMYFTWNETLFPDPKKMSEDLRAQGKEMVTITDPHIKVSKDYLVFTSGVEEDVFVKEIDRGQRKPRKKIFEAQASPGLSAWPDFTSARVRAWWGRFFSPNGQNDDFYGWNDLNEPSVRDVPEKTMYRDLIHSEGTEHRDVHNLYGHYFRWASFEGQRLHRFPGKRPFVLTRSVFAGSHRFGPMYTGDNVAQWNNLQAVIPMTTALAATGGFSFTGSDIGGFSGHPDAELYTRWFQLSAATSAFFRLHSDIHSPQRDPWLYDQDTLNRLKNATLERYRLLPYWYHAFARYVYYGEPVIRPLWYVYIDDPNTYKSPPQVLIGADIMVRGVVEKSVKKVKVYFPQHTQWYSTAGKLMTSGWQDVDVTMDDIPRYFRAGSIIP